MNLWSNEACFVRERRSSKLEHSGFKRESFVIYNFLTFSLSNFLTYLRR